VSVLRVAYENCDGCGACVAVCPFDGVVLEEGVPRFGAGCRVCGLCIDACPRGALGLPGEEDAGDVADLSRYRGVMVVSERAADGLDPVTLELMGEGRRLADALGEALSVVVAGADVDAEARECLVHGADRVLVLDHPSLAHFRPEPYTDALEGAVRHALPSIVLMAGTPVGRSLAPRLAVRLRTGLTADCTSLEVNERGELLQTRPAFGGDIMATILSGNHRPQMATVRPRVMPRAGRLPVTGTLERLPFRPDPEYPGRVLEVREKPAADTVADADVVVAAGRGIRRAEDLDMLHRLADALGGVVGCSRPLVEAGWLPSTQQVGLSGRTVRPKLYIACGISGAIQHVAGMRGSERIIAINPDENAPIFDVAHHALVGDAYEIIPALLDRIEERGDARAV